MSKQLETAYIYADGHSVEIWSKKDKDCGKVQWVEIREKYAKPTFQEGRVIFSSPDWYAYYELAKGNRLEAEKPSLKNGSTATQEKGFSVGHVKIHIKNKSIIDYNIPGILSGQLTYQEDVSETFNDVKEKKTWSIITKVHFAK